MIKCQFCTDNFKSQKISIDIRPYTEKDVLYFFEFKPQKEDMEEPTLLNDTNLHFFKFGVTSNLIQRQKNYGNTYRLDKCFIYNSGYLKSLAEKYIKQVVFDMNLKFFYKNSLECMMCSYEKLEEIYKIMEKHSKIEITDIKLEEKKHNEPNTTFVCELCSSLFKNKYNLKKHQILSKRCKSANTIAETFKCLVCETEFFEKSLFANHLVESKCIEIHVKNSSNEINRLHKQINNLMLKITNFNSQINNITTINNTIPQYIDPTELNSTCNQTYEGFDQELNIHVIIESASPVRPL